MALSAAVCVRAQPSVQRLADEIKRSDNYEWAEAAGNPKDTSFDKERLKEQALAELARKINGAVVHTVSHTRQTELTEDFESRSEIRTSAIFKSIKTLEITARNRIVIFAYVDRKDIVSLQESLSSSVKDYIIAALAAESRGDIPDALHLYCCAYTVVRRNPYIDFGNDRLPVEIENDDTGLWLESNISRILRQFDIKLCNIEQRQGTYPYLITLQCNYCGGPAQNITLKCSNGYMPRSVTDDRGQVQLYMEGLRSDITVGIECMRDNGDMSYDPGYVNNLPSSSRVISLNRTGVAYKDYDIKSIPRGASIRIDGSAAGSAPLKCRLTAEYHNIEAEYDGRTLYQGIDLARKSDIEPFDFRESADVCVSSKYKYDRANIYIDNKEFETDPDRVLDRSLRNGETERIPVGRYRLIIKGYRKSSVKHIDVMAGADNNFSFEYPRKRTTGLSVIPQLTYSSSTLGYGGMIIFQWGSVCPYVKYTSTFNGGFVSDNPLPEAQFESLSCIGERYSAMSVTAGVQIRVGRSGGPYAGFGYGHRQHMAQCADAVYYNADNRFRNVDFELGYVFHMGRFRLSAGVTMPAIWLGQVFYHGGYYVADLLHIKGAWRIDHDSEWGTFKHPYNFIEFNVGLGFMF